MTVGANAYQNLDYVCQWNNWRDGEEAGWESIMASDSQLRIREYARDMARMMKKGGVKVRVIERQPDGSWIVAYPPTGKRGEA